MVQKLIKSKQIVIDQDGMVLVILQNNMKVLNNVFWKTL